MHAAVTRLFIWRPLIVSRSGSATLFPPRHWRPFARRFPGIGKPRGFFPKAWNILFIAAAPACWTIPAFATTHYVWTNSPAPADPFTSWTTAAHTIQAAVDSAEAGDVVAVTNGLYDAGGRPVAGYTVTNRLVITNGVTVRSVNGATYTRISGTAWGPSAVRCVYLGPGAVLEGFTLTNGHTSTSGDVIYDRSGGGALMESNSVLRNCIVRNNTGEYYGGGIYAQGGRLEGCLIEHNDSYGFVGGIHNGQLVNCTVFDNHTTGDAGGTFSGTLCNCIVWSNTADANYPNWQGGDIAYTCTMPLPAGSGNTTNDPLFVEPAGGDLHLQRYSPCMDAGTNGAVGWGEDLDGHPRIIRGTVDMGAYERQDLHYVSPGGAHVSPFLTWEEAATNIQAAVDAAAAGDIVIVSNGTYGAGGRPVAGYALTNRLVITNGLTVRSVNGAKYTSISGAGPIGSHAVRCVYLGPGAVLEGFTLTHGYTRTAGDDVYDRSGGGALMESNSVLRNCIVADSVANYLGGGIYAQGGRLEGCLIKDNDCTRWVGGVHNGYLVNCTVFGNHAGNDAGGTFSGTLRNCIVWSNTADANYPNWQGGDIAYTCTTPLPLGTANTTNDPLFVAPSGSNLHLQRYSPCMDAGSNGVVGWDEDLDGNPRIAGPTVDMGAYERRYLHYVSPGGSNVSPFLSWEEAATNIQAAVDAAGTGEVVIVTNGTYGVGGRPVAGYALTNRLVITNGITVRSVNGATYTSIRGAGPIGPHAVRCVYLAPDAVLEGFTLTQGYTDSAGDEVYDRCGGGALMESNSILRNCIVSNNTSRIDGGGIYAQGGRIFNSLVRNNSASQAGGVHNGYLVNCTVFGNHAAGDAGGTYSGSLRNCIVWSNTAGANYPNWQGGDIAYTCTTPLPAGTGNTTSAPRLKDPGAGDFHPLYGSPCLDSADPADSLTNDLDGIARPLDGNYDGTNVADMGCYEYNPATADSNGDGVPDWWYHGYGLNPTNSIMAVIDSDGDGPDNRDEYIADTVPTNGASYLHITACSNDSPVTVYFDSSSNRLYSLQGCPGLITNDWLQITSKTGAGGPDWMTDTNAPPRGPFYRVEAALP